MRTWPLRPLLGQVRRRAAQVPHLGALPWAAQGVPAVRKGCADLQTLIAFPPGTASVVGVPSWFAFAP
eukprot:672110-Lingulodinium_polyedra.AAC.1